MNQIMQSGSGTIPPVHDAVVGNSYWSSFAAAVPQCASLASSNNTFECLQSVDASVILQAASASTPAGTDPANLAWYYTLDGPSGIFPDLPSNLLSGGKYARIPFIAGTVLDECQYHLKLAKTRTFRNTNRS